MLHINKMTDYGLRVIRAICSADSEIVTSRLISEKENIPNAVLMKVLRVLKQNNILTSSRGRGDKSGGYSLSVHPKDLTLLDIITALEGDIFLNECVQKNSDCCFRNNCTISKEFHRINEVLKYELSKISFEELSCPKVQELDSSPARPIHYSSAPQK